ncbi:MAG: DUF5335 family protein [Bacteroidetes bacterium]|nr:DUF5335 family protein [Bacteroidota bacterium]
MAATAQARCLFETDDFGSVTVLTRGMTSRADSAGVGRDERASYHEVIVMGTPMKGISAKKIDKGEWMSFFSALAQDHRRRKQVDYAEVRIMSREIGVQKEVSWLPLIGITYDQRNDVIDLSVENMNHMIQHPKEVFVDDGGNGHVRSIEVMRNDGIVELIEIR